MSRTEVNSSDTGAVGVGRVGMKLEVVVIPGSELASVLWRAEAAHGEHEQRTGQRDANWPDGYAAYTVAEQAGEELPT